MANPNSIYDASNRVARAFNRFQRQQFQSFINSIPNAIYNAELAASTMTLVHIPSIDDTIAILLESQRRAMLAFQSLLDALLSTTDVQTSVTFESSLDDEPFHGELVTSANASQAPPSLIESAIENAYYNIDKFKNSKLIIMIKSKCPAFIETLVFETLKYIIYKLLGM